MDFRRGMRFFFGQIRINQRVRRARKSGFNEETELDAIELMREVTPDLTEEQKIGRCAHDLSPECYLQRSDTVIHCGYGEEVFVAALEQTYFKPTKAKT